MSAATIGRSSAASSFADIASKAAAASSSASPGVIKAFKFRPTWRYLRYFRTYRFGSFLSINGQTECVRSMVMTFQHAETNLIVTLCPMVHKAHPIFFLGVDELCCQHESVLCEGRSPLKNAPHSTLVPGRDLPIDPRPVGLEGDEPWEPLEMSKFAQPFSFGVNDSPRFTVVHAADTYEPDTHHLLYRLRYQIPLLGHYKREKHCLEMIPHLAASGYKSFIIPWGVGHMPILATMLEDNGFVQIGMTGLMTVAARDGPVCHGIYRKISFSVNTAQQVEDFTDFLVGVALFFILYLTAVRMKWIDAATSIV